jgi:hypothetical protein
MQPNTLWDALTVSTGYRPREIWAIRIGKLCFLSVGARTRSIHLLVAVSCPKLPTTVEHWHIRFERSSEDCTTDEQES